MTAIADPTRSYADDFAAVADRLPGHDVPWWSEARRAALERFRELGFPSTRPERWRYTDVRRIAEARFVPAPPPASADVARARAVVDAAALPPPQGARWVFVDGHHVPGLSVAAELSAGVAATGLAELAGRDPERLRAHLGAVAGEADHAFTALNTAFTADGLVLEVAAGAAMDRPLELVFVTTGGTGPKVVHPRVLVVTGDNARARIDEYHLGDGDGGHLSNALVEAVVAPGAAVGHTRLQLLGGKDHGIGGLHAVVGREGRFESRAFDLGGRLVRHEVRVALAGEGAEADLTGLALVGRRRHADTQTHVEHRVPHTRCNEAYRTVVEARGRGVFGGKFHVHEGARQTDAHMKSDNLLLSKKAEVDTRPELEIYNDDVQCSHGATVGQLDEDALFYLRSRGIGGEEARSLLVHAFAAGIVERVDGDALRQWLGARIDERLGRGEDGSP